MIIKIGNQKLYCTRKGDHKSYLFSRIMELRSEVIDEVLIGTQNNRIPVKLLKEKAKLIKKYSRRLKLIDI
jgi:hypothetical protein